MSAEQEVVELRARVARLEARMEQLYAHLGLAYDEDPSLSEQQVLEPLRRGNMIEAIKVYREIHRVGLAEAKQAVEALRSRLGT